MISKDNLPNLLNVLGFEKNGASYRKFIGASLLSVNTVKEEISYPDGIEINERQTLNFSANENFVVLECVHRLLEKGYKPEHIELEPKWKLGHGASGGRADILIKDNNGKPLLIIECKTAGSEFNKAWNKTMQDGDQLFSYAQQISETQFLCLYCSDFSSNELNYTSQIIAHRDNEKYLIDNPELKRFSTATDVKERFTIWRDTYKHDFTSKGIFEANIQPYHIGKDKYTLDDLSIISAADQQKKYHEFATILRQHNVSGRENAFDKLVNLFLCKLVDEIENPNELKFYWKGVAYDTHFDLMDRLQQLYQRGMGKFLGEEITYINQTDVFNAMRFIRQNPDATQRAVWGLFVQQKFFTNNDFSLIDVHNEKLFYQNAEVVLKILQMWQDIRLTNPDGNNQFLGDLFEGFLDQGVKQSEGQYFTPMPICRFILMSLPLENLIANNATPPKSIDYACGAGHFLNELALQIKPLVRQYQPESELADYHKAIFGIEKEYRLSKVAKVSAFMYGQKDINICYGDALVSAHSAFPAIQDNSFDILVANPPYSVKGFLETLPENERKAYRLLDSVGDLETANSIEAFFIERTKQLLKAGGVAALILPSSILSNGSGVYIRTREILLQYFDLVAIAEFGSGTFGKTGTNTVTLFLRRKSTTPDTAAHYRERVAQWFSVDDSQTIYQDEHLINAYALHIGIEPAAYKELLQGQAHGEWCKHAVFEDYTKAFNDSSEIKRLYTQPKFKALSQAQKEDEIDQRYLAFVHATERDKLYHFVMASTQTHPVLIIRSPTETKAAKRFLGYDWSSAKGGEGIKLIKDANGYHLTKLYDETNRNNSTKLNRFISENFNGQLATIPVELSEFAATARLVDMLDFSRISFEKQITLAGKKVSALESKWPMVKLERVTQIVNGGTPDTNNAKFWDGGDIYWATLVDTKEKYLINTQRKITKAGLKHSNLLPVNTVIFSSRATIGEVCINKVPTATNQGYKNFICDPLKINYEYLYYLLVSLRSEFENLVPSGSKYKEINTTTMREYSIPLPSLDVQNKIATESEEIDTQAEKANARILANLDLIQKLLLDASNSDMRPLAQIVHKVSDSVDPQVESGVAFYIGLENIESGSGQLVGNTDTPYAEIKSNKTRFQSGDVLYGKLRPNLNKVYLTQQDGICSTDILVFRFQNPIQARFYATYFLCDAFNAEVLKGVSGQQLPRTSWSNMQTIKVPVFAGDELKKMVTQIGALEEGISTAQALIAAAPAKKQAILQSYL